MNKKKGIQMLVLIGMAFSLIACGNGNRDNQNKRDIEATPQSTQLPSKTDNLEKNQNPSANILVVYFSCTGTTQSLAEMAAELLEADLYEIVPEIGYTSADLDYNDDSSRATLEQKDETARPQIMQTDLKLEDYDTLVLAYPLWWGQAPKIMYTFLESYDFEGKTIATFCTSHSSEMGSSLENLKSLVQANWLEGQRFSSSTTKEELQVWFEEMKFIEETE